MIRVDNILTSIQTVKKYSESPMTNISIFLNTFTAFELVIIIRGLLRLNAQSNSVITSSLGPSFCVYINLEPLYLVI